MSSRSVFTVSGAVLAGAFLVSACNSVPAQSNSGSSVSGQGQVINIGLIAAVTGDNALEGTNMKNGAQLAVDQINQQGGVNGKKLNLVVEDDQSSNPGAVNAFQKVTQMKGVSGIVGPLLSTEVQALQSVIKQSGIPTTAGATNPALTHQGDPWLFRVRADDSISGQVMADYTVNTLKAKRVAILSASDSFGKGGREVLLNQYKAMGLTPVLDKQFDDNTNDFTSVLEAVKSSNADVVNIYIAKPAESVKIVEQAQRLGVKQTIIGSPTLLTQTVLKLVNGAANGYYGVQDFVTTVSSQSAQFAKDYQQAYNGPADDESAYTYDAVKIFANVFAKYGTNPDDVKKGILATQGYNGALGTFNFDQYGNGNHSYTVVQIQNGQPVAIKTIQEK